MKECCETEGPKPKRYWHWVALGGVVVLAAGLQLMPERRYSGGIPVAKADITSIEMSLTEYAINNKGAFPTTLEPLVTPDTNGRCYLEGRNMKLPLDPWKRPYLYEPPTPGHPRPRVWSYGADGKLGGTGDNADVDSDRLHDPDR